MRLSIGAPSEDLRQFVTAPVYAISRPCHQVDDEQKISLAVAALRFCSAILYMSLLVGAHVPDVVEVGYCRQRYKRCVSIASDLTINWLRSQHFCCHLRNMHPSAVHLMVGV